MNDLFMGKEEFNRLMETMDEKLKKNGFLIPQRPFHAISLFAKTHKVKVHSSSMIVKRINNWYDERYGDLLKVDLGLGEVALLIKNDPYKMQIPWFLGTFCLVCDKSCATYPEETKKYDPLIKREIPVINVLGLIEGLTYSVAATLSDSDLKSILEYFIFASKTMSSFRVIKDLTYKAEAETNLRMAVANLLNQVSPQYGQSKWDSLQFTEKIMKGFIIDWGKKEPPHTHELLVLNTILDQNTLPKIPEYLLNNIQCKPAVRYERSLVNLDECINAHYSSLKVLSILLGVEQEKNSNTPIIENVI